MFRKFVGIGNSCSGIFCLYAAFVPEFPRSILFVFYYLKGMSERNDWEDNMLKMLTFYVLNLP